MTRLPEQTSSYDMLQLPVHWKRVLNTVTQNLAESGVCFTWVLLLKSHTIVNTLRLPAQGGVTVFKMSLKQHHLFSWINNT